MNHQFRHLSSESLKDNSAPLAPVCFAAVIRRVVIEAMWPPVLMPAPIGPKNGSADSPLKLRPRDDANEILPDAQIDSTQPEIIELGENGKEPSENAIGRSFTLVEVNLSILTRDLGKPRDQKSM
jgi:hypothetical protein